MEHVNIDLKFSIANWADLEGTQTKFYKDGFWYKIDTLGCEGLAEELSSVLLSCSNIKEYVSYTRCEINDKKGCKSYSFLEDGDHFISIQKLYKNYTGKDISDKIREFNNCIDRYNYILDFVKKNTNLDITEYLQNTFALDLLILNPDRHFGNLGIILTKNNEFKIAPIFDNGQGLFQNFQITPPYLSDEEKIENLSAATISGSFEEQVRVAGNSLKINYKQLFNKLSNYPESIAKRCLYNQLKQYEKIFSIDYNQKEHNYDYEK